MSPSAEYIKRLSALQEGERSSLRRLAGRPLDASLQGFDTFTGLWWPLRAKNSAAPRREPSWLVAKLCSSFPIPHIATDSAARSSFPEVLVRLEPAADYRHFQNRFEALLCSNLASLEPHLRWALGEIAPAVADRVRNVKDVKGIDWVELLDHLSIWDQGGLHGRDVREIWAERYLNKSASQERKF